MRCWKGNEGTVKLFEVNKTLTLPFTSKHHFFLILYLKDFLLSLLSFSHKPTQNAFICIKSNEVCVCWCCFLCMTVCSLCALACDCRKEWVMLMSGRRVVISEPQAGRQEAAKQLVIWCGLRYCSPGVKLSVWARDLQSHKWDSMDQPPVCGKQWQL